MLVTAEFWPLAKTGGLGDMVYSIATSLRDSGFQVRVVIPGYRSILRKLGAGAKDVGGLLALGHQARLLVQDLHGMEIVIVRCDPLYDRPGNIYMKDFRTPWSDNAQRFGVLCYAAASIVNGRTAIPAPELLHIHDWHAGPTPAYLDPEVDIPVILTVQNFMFQGRFPRRDILGLGLEGVTAAGELFSGFSFLQAGLQLADVLTTVSPSYVDEIKKGNRFNWYYVNPTNQEKLISITNWPETDVWNPASDTSIPAQYDIDSLEHRKINRIALQRRLNWGDMDGPILCTLSRITKAKGFQFLFKNIGLLLERGCRVVLAGEGDRPLVNAARSLQAANPGRIALITPYREEDARLVLSGADALLMPSLTEPCGLSQQHAQIYGCVPVVSRVGGLPDTVTEGQTGFIFDPSDRASFLAAIDRLLLRLGSATWRSLQQDCMRVHEVRAARTAYADLFLRLHQRKQARAGHHAVNRPSPAPCIEGA
ncbi:MAG TPA: glycogen/starch synthase [Allosphingosinicella sp.]